MEESVKYLDNIGINADKRDQILIMLKDEFKKLLTGDQFISMHEKYRRLNKNVNAETAFWALYGTIQMYYPNLRLPYSSYESFRAAKSQKKRRKRAKNVNTADLENRKP